MATVVRHVGPVPLIAQALLRSLRTLMRDLRSEASDESKWTFIRESLESLPLATADFSLAANRLSSAEKYCSQGEFGAGRYELHQVLRSLEPLAH